MKLHRKTCGLKSNALLGLIAIWLMASLHPAQAQQTITYTANEDNTGAILITGTLNPTTLQVNGTNSATQSGVISDSGTAGAVIKTGTGTLVLTSANTYTGGTTIKNGTLEIANDYALGIYYPVDIQANGTLEVNTALATIGNLTGAGTLNILPADYVFLQETGTNTFSGTLEGGTLTDPANVVLGGGGTLKLTGTTTMYGNIDVLYGELDLASASSLSNNTTISVGSGQITVEAGLSVVTGGLVTTGSDGAILLRGSLTVELPTGATGATSDFAGTISGTGGFGVDGANVLQTLSGTSTYSGATTITLGTLQAGSTTGLSKNSDFTIMSTGTLDINGYASTIGSLAGSGYVINSGVETTLKTNGDGNSTTFSGTIGNGVDLIKVGADTLTLSGTNSYNGTTSVNAGTLAAGSTTGFSSNSDFTVTSGGTLDIAGYSSTIGSLAGGGSVVNSGVSGTLTTNGDGNNSNFSGTIGDGIDLVKDGSGRLTLSGTNTYNGATTILNGVLAAGSTTALSANSAFTVNGTLNLAGYDSTIGSLAGSGTVASNGTPTTLTAGGDNTSTTFSGTINGNIALVKTGTGTMTLSGNSNSNLTTEVSAGTLQAGSTTGFSNTSDFTVDTGATLDIGGYSVAIGSLTGSGNVVNSGAESTLKTNGDGSSTIFSGTIGDGVDLNKVGADTLTLTGTNSYNGTTTVTVGTLAAGSTTAFSANSDFTVTTNGTLDLAGFSNSVGSLAGQGTVVNSGAEATLTTNGDGNNSTFGGAITGSIDLVKTGNDTLTLNGVNTYTGTTTISQGRLSIGTGGSIEDSSLVSISSGGTFSIANGGSQTIQDLSGVAGSKIALGANELTLGTANDIEFDGTIVGTGGSLYKQGLGSLKLTGANTYSGGTTLASGTLIIGNSSALGTGALTTLDPTVVYTNGIDVANPIIMMGDTILEVDNLDTATQSGSISESGGSYGITKVGSGFLTLTGTNTYSGTTEVAGGILEVDSPTTGLGTGNATVDSGATLALYNAATLTNSITISGTGTAGQGAIYSFGDGTTQTESVSGTVTLAANATIGNAGNNSTLQMGDINLQGNTLTVGMGSGNIYLNGSISGTGGLIFNGFGDVQITGGNNTFTGLTDVLSGSNLGLSDTMGTAISGNLLIEDSGYVQDNVGGQLASTTVLALLGDGEFLLTPQGSTSLTETIAGLSGTSTISMIAASGASASATTSNTITLSGTGTYDYAGQISDDVSGTFAASLALVKSGSGTQILSGSNFYTGGTVINSGTMVVGSSNALGSGDVVLNGGLLTTTASGTAIQITIGGNYTQTGGTLLLNIYSASNYDSVNLTSGLATVGGTLMLNLVGGFAPGTGESFTVLTSTQTVSGSFASVVTNLPSIGLKAEYTNDVTVLYQKSFVDLLGNTLTPNERTVATYIDTYDLTSNNPGFNNLVGALNSISGDPQALAGAFNQLTAVNFFNFVGNTVVNNASFTTQQFDNYLANHRGADGSFVSSPGGIDYSGLAVNNPQVDPGLQAVSSRLLAWSPPPSTGVISDSGDAVLGGDGGMKQQKTWLNPEPAKINTFVSGNVVLAQDFSDASTGTSGGNSTTGAVQVGADCRITPHLLIGATFGYGHTSATLDNMGSSATVNTYSPGIYMSYSNDGWYYNVLGSYGFADYSQSRKVSIGGYNGTASSSPGGSQVVANLDGGYDFHKGDWTFGPTVGLQYVHLKVDGYSETGLPGADLMVNQTQNDSLRSLLGGRVNYTVKSGSLLFIPHLSASWQHEFLDQSMGVTSQFSSVGAGSFVVNTTNPSRDSALIDVGLDTQFNDTVTGFVDYAAQAGQSNYFGQSVQAGVKIGF